MTRKSQTSSPPVVARRTAHKPLKPFTTDHFRAYARNLILDTGEPWNPEGFQLEVVADLFGPVPEVWMVVPEGNGKTTLMGGVALYYADYTPTAMVLLGAASRDQCGVLFGQAAGFVYRSGLNKTRFRVFEGYRRIDSLRTGGKIQVYAADDRTGDGVIPGGIVLLDELHRQRDMRLYETWRGKLDKRGAKLCAISTAGEPGTQFENARVRITTEAKDKTVKGAHLRAATPQIILHDWSLEKGKSPDDMRAVKRANPFSGVSIERLRSKRLTPTTTEAHWRRFVCNLATRSDSAAISEAEWDARVTGETIPYGEPVWAGLDLGWKWDTSAIVPLWMESLEHRVFGVPQIVTPPRDGTSTPPEKVQAAILLVHEANPIHTIVMDENAGGAQLVGWIESEIGAQVITHSQAHTAMCLAYERWMEAMRLGWHVYPDHAEFKQHAMNAVARLLPGDQTRFDRPAGARNTRTKTTQDRRVWDALTAASMVHSVAVGELDAEPERPFDLADYRIEQL